MRLSANSQGPLYQQLKELIQKSIISEELKPGDQILTESELSEKYGVSRITVRKAVSELVDERVLLKIQGKGTFVRSMPISDPIKETINFSTLCQMQGMTPSARVLQQEMVRAQEYELEFFSLPPGSYVVHLRRLRLANDIPVLIETDNFHPAMSMLISEDMTQSLYRVLEKYNSVPAKVRNAVGIHYATAEEAAILGIAANTPLLKNQSRVYGGDGKPLHTCIQIVRVDSGVFQYYV